MSDNNGKTFALNALGIVALNAYNADEYRHSVERMEPAHYLTATYCSSHGLSFRSSSAHRFPRV